MVLPCLASRNSFLYPLLHSPRGAPAFVLTQWASVGSLMRIPIQPAGGLSNTIWRFDILWQVYGVLCTLLLDELLSLCGEIAIGSPASTFPSARWSPRHDPAVLYTAKYSLPSCYSMLERTEGAQNTGSAVRPRQHKPNTRLMELVSLFSE
jgi:hypothetical protein